jgi:cytochrome b involved in lipid metabolism
MTTRLISIIVGLLVVIGAGTSVYIKKQPVIVPTEENTQSINPTAANTGSNTVTKQLSSEQEDEDEWEDGSVANPKTTTTTQTSPTPTTSTTGGITLAQVAKHNSRTSCWSAINGNVYDLTSWIPNHPGGEQAILYLCGIDGSAAYNGQHGGNAKTTKILTGFKIGALTK